MTVRFYDWAAARNELLDDWQSLVRATGCNPSLHPEWLHATLTAWNKTEAAKVALVRTGAGDTAVIPFFFRRRSYWGIPVRSLELCSNVFSYHADIVCSGNPEAALSEFLGSVPGWDVFRIANAPADGGASRALAALVGRGVSTVTTMSTETSPYVSMTGNWTEFLATRPRKVRSNISRTQRLMREAGESALVWYESGSDTGRLFAEMLDVEAQSWKADAGVSIVSGTPQGHYYSQLLPWLSRHGLLANVLYVRGRATAYTLCARWNGWFGQLKTSHAKNVKDAGSRVIDSSLERAFELGGHEYDFLGDVAPHKLRWTEQVRPHVELWAYGQHVQGRSIAFLKRSGSAVKNLVARRKTRALRGDGEHEQQ